MKISFTNLIILAVFVSVLLPTTICLATENITDTMLNTIDPVKLPSGDEDPEGRTLEIIGKVINVFLGFMGVVFFVLMVYGGFTWMMAKGKEEDVQKAKDIIRAAIIGLVVIMAAFAISYFITTRIELAVRG